MVNIPLLQNRIWKQNNTSDIFNEFTSDNLFATFNCDLTENKGRVRLGKRLVINTNTVDTADVQGIPCAFKEYNNNNVRIFAICGNDLLISNDDFPSAVSFARHSNSLTTFDSRYSDMEVFHDNLYATTPTTLEKLTTGTSWSTVNSGLDAGTPHMLAKYADRLYITSGTTKIYSWSGAALATSGQYTIDLGSSDTQRNAITFIKPASNRIWIGTNNMTSGKAFIYEWDGNSSTFTKEYRIESPGALACVIKNDIPYVLDAYGRLLAWNGGTFVEVATLNRRRNKYNYLPLSFSNNRFVHPNGISLVNGRINILIDGKAYDNALNSASTDEATPSGVWEYTEENGLYHKHSVGLTHVGETITDYGQSRIAAVGALTELNYPDNSTSRNGTFLTGVQYYTDATTTTYGIFYDDTNDTLQKSGSFITGKIESSGITAEWQKMYLNYRRLLSSTDKIVVKYRIEDIPPIEATITWTSTTTFTTTTDISSYWTAGTGGEVEVIQGIGAGRCSHITGYTLSAGTYTVTVDETYTGATGTSKARFQAWNKLLPIANDQITHFKEIGIGLPSDWMQFKVWALFTGKDEINRLLIDNQAFNK